MFALLALFDAVGADIVYWDLAPWHIGTRVLLVVVQYKMHQNVLLKRDWW